MRTTSSHDCSGTAAPLMMTLRGIDPELRAALEAEAARRGVSLNALVLQLLRTSLGLSGGSEVLHHDLDGLAGVWTAAEAAEFRDAVRDFEKIDPDLWEPGADGSRQPA